MAYVVYRTSDSKIVNEKAYGKEVWATEGAAKAAMTRIIKKNRYPGAELRVQELGAYRMLIEEKVERVNMMSGEKYMESINTPNYCSPSSEAYWSA
jgi:hypothetical protein